jgi:hypothetical protein
MLFRRIQQLVGPSRVSLTRAAVGCFFVAGLLWATTARAEFYSYTTTVTPLTTTQGTVTVTLSTFDDFDPGNNSDATFPGTDIIFGQVSVAPITNATVLTSFNIPYTFHLAMQDYSSGGALVPNNAIPVDFLVSGTLVGTVGPGKKINFTNTFDQVSVSHVVGGETYELSSLNLLLPGVLNPGFFGAHLSTVVPEPSTITLMGFGAVVMATPVIRRWRRALARRG